MMENLDALLSKIRTEGVDAAKQEAADIVAKAKAEAADIVAKAKAEATAMTTQAQADAQRMAMGAEATIRQAARDVLLKLGQDVTALLEQTLGGAVDETLKSATIIEKVVVDAIAAYQSSGEVTIAAAETVVAALKAKLAKKKDVTVVTDAQIGSGFRVRLAGGRVEHDFTGDSVTAALAALLRPQLAKLLKD
jgi:V/A-type H+-transporting ATPase subunit E